MSNAWLLRPYPHNIKRLDEFKCNNIIAIGWPNIGDLTGKSKEEIKSILSGAPYNLSSIKLGNSYGTVDIFVNRMNIGDLVLIPDDNDIYFCKITSNYYIDNSVDNDKQGYPHQRTITWLSSCLRKDLSMNLRSSLKTHGTTADLTKHFDEINALANGKKYITKSIETLKINYPLRKDFNVSFEIPKDINKTEAKRLSQYFETLYFE